MSKFISQYGIAFPEQIHPIAIELACFRDHWPKDKGGLGTAEHLKRAIKLIWCTNYKAQIKREPALIWHRWLDLTIDKIYEEMQVTKLRTGETVTKQFAALAGCSRASKSYIIAAIVLCFWYCDPQNTGALICSTTIESAHIRIWGAIKRLHNYARLIGLPGHLIESTRSITFDPKEKQYDRCIKLRPVKHGEKEQSVDDLIGWHPPRFIIVADEMTSLPDSLFQALANLSNVETEFIFIGIGNPESRLDNHGIFCAPKDGWTSVNIEMESWKTNYGICIHYDGLKSPNFDEETFDHFKFIFKQDDYDSQLKMYGEGSASLYRMARGWFPSETMDKNLLNEAVLFKNKVFDPPIWKYTLTKIAGLDPAYGGDRCAIYFAEIGVTKENKLCIYPYKYLILPINPEDKEPVHYQIAKMVKQSCMDEGVSPHNFGLDSTGDGKGVASILMNEWSIGIILVEFGDKVSTRPVSHLINRPSNEEYDRKATELLYSIRQYIDNGQMKGIHKETAREGCKRRVEYKKKICVETKSDFRDREKYSPDLLDALSVVCDVARTLGYVPGAPPPYSSINEYHYTMNNPEPKWEEVEAEFSDPYAYSL